MAIKPEDIYKRPTIAERGGIPDFLDLPDQLEKHNGHGKDKWIEWHELGLKPPKLAELYNVSPGTIRKWERLERDNK